VQDELLQPTAPSGGAGSEKSGRKD